MVYRFQAQPVCVLQGELPVRLQLEPQVGARVRCRHPVPGVCQVRAEVQEQASNSLCGGHAAPAGVELHAHRPNVRGHRLHAFDEVLQGVGHHEQVLDVGLDEVPLGLSWRA